MGFMDTIRKITGAEEEDDDQEYEMKKASGQGVQIIFPVFRRPERS